MRGELDFEAALSERVALLRDLPETTLARVADERLSITPGARELVATMRHHGAYCVLVSGGFTFFTGRIARAVGFDENRANTLEIAAGRLTGRPVTAAAERAAPPRESPSSLVSTMPVMPILSWNSAALRTASCPVRASATYRTSFGSRSM